MTTKWNSVSNDYMQYQTVNKNADVKTNVKHARIYRRKTKEEISNISTRSHKAEANGNRNF